MNWRVPFCALLFAVINLLMVSTGAARLAGVYTKRIATALTLFNTFVLVSRMANLLMVPEIGRLADIARAAGTLRVLQTEFRIILGSATVGCVMATFLIPTFVEVFRRGISGFERTTSLPRLFFGLLRPTRNRILMAVLMIALAAGSAAGYWAGLSVRFSRYGMNAWIGIAMMTAVAVYITLAAVSWLLHPEIFRPPSWMGVSFRSLKRIPKDFLILNVFVQAFWTVGWMSAVYAGAADSRVAITAVSLSGIITGVSTILLTVFVDPKAALITDQAAHGIRTEEEIKAVVMFLTVGSVFGTLFAQALFTPAAQIIAFVASRI